MQPPADAPDPDALAARQPHATDRPADTSAPHPDDADTTRLVQAIQRLSHPLEAFNRFEEPDPTAANLPAWTRALNQPLPQQGAGLEAVLDDLAEVVIPHGLRTGAPGFAAWVTTAPTTAGVAAALAALSAGSQRYWLQAFSLLEDVGLRWLAELLGLGGHRGVFTGGGSSANLVALGAARQRAWERLGVDPAAEGVPGGRQARLYASEEVHHVVMRAAGVLGLGRRAVVGVAADRAGRLDVAALAARLRADAADDTLLPVAVVASAGTVNTGVVDPLGALADVAAEHDVWLHVDGAYGGFGYLDPAVASWYEGWDRADSVAVDPHKWMAAPLGCGAALVRDRDLLARAFTLEPAEYVEGSLRPGAAASPWDDLGTPYHHLGVDQSAPSRGVTVWAILREIGVDGLRHRVVRHNGFARHLAARARRDDRLELLAEPVLSICCFRYRPPDRHLDEAALDRLNAEIVARLHRTTPHIPSTTRVGGTLAIRPCYINPRTRRADVDGLADAVCVIGDELTASAR